MEIERTEVQDHTTLNTKKFPFLCFWYWQRAKQWAWRKGHFPLSLKRLLWTSSTTSCRRSLGFQSLFLWFWLLGQLRDGSSLPPLGFLLHLLCGLLYRFSLLTFIHSLLYCLYYAFCPYYVSTKVILLWIILPGQFDFKLKCIYYFLFLLNWDNFIIHPYLGDVWVFFFFCWIKVVEGRDTPNTTG